MHEKNALCGINRHLLSITWSEQPVSVHACDSRFHHLALMLLRRDGVDIRENLPGFDQWPLVAGDRLIGLPIPDIRLQN